jgi:hypothetical protein
MENQKELNIRQLKFIDGLLEGKTQKKAYIDAGYETTDDHSTEVAASRLLRNVNIQEEITKRLDDLKTRNRMRLYRISEVALVKIVNILQSDKKIADSNVKADLIKYVLDGVGLKPIEEHNLNVKGTLESNLSEEQMNGLIELAHKAIKPDMQTQDKKPNKE